jgi:hypothetical protein
MLFGCANSLAETDAMSIRCADAELSLAPRFVRRLGGHVRPASGHLLMKLIDPINYQIRYVRMVPQVARGLLAGALAEHELKLVSR